MICSVAVLVLLISLCLSAEGSVIHRTYQWQYGDRWWVVDFDIPASAYAQQQSTTRMLNVSDYSRYASDPRDDAILTALIERLEALAIGLNVWDRLNLVIAFVQSIPYVSET